MTVTKLSIFARLALFTTAIFGAITIAVPAYAALNIDINRPNVEPMPIAITNLFGSSPNETKIGLDVAKVISDDLQRSGLFRPIAQNAFIQTPEALRTQPRFGDWRVINAQALVSGAAIRMDGQIAVGNIVK